MPPWWLMYATTERTEVAKSIEDRLQFQYVDVAPLEVQVPDARGVVGRHGGSPPEAGSIGRYSCFRSRQLEGESLFEIGSVEPPVQARADNIRNRDGEIERVRLRAKK